MVTLRTSFFAVPEDFQLVAFADVEFFDRILEGFRAVDIVAVQTQHHVAGFQAGFGGGGIRQDLSDQCPGIGFDVQLLRQGAIEVLDHHAQKAALDFAFFDELVGDPFGHVDRDGKPDAVVPAAPRGDRRVDADDFAPQVQERSAAVAGVDRRIGLQVVFALD